MNQSAVTTSRLSDGVRKALEVSLRGVEELLPQDEWAKKLARSEATGQPLRIKLGLDPTAPDIHIGHTVVLNKMRQLQDLGHQVIFLIGDFTTPDRRPLGPQQHAPAAHARADQANAETYYPRPAWCWTRRAPRFATTASGATPWARAA
jgi:tyrosyl-tRNA synthetase